MARPSLPSPLEGLVPHRGPMCLLETLDAYTDEVGEAVGRVRTGHLFEEPDGSLHPVVAVEMLAQGAAAHEGYRRLCSGVAVGGGFLASVRNFTLPAAPRVGDTVRVVAKRDLAVGSLQTVQGRVLRGEELVGEGELMFFLSDELVPEQMASAATASGELPDCDGPEPLTAAVARARIKLDRDRGVASYRLDAGFPAFSGHFPGFPVLPAVASVVFAEQTIAAVSGRPLRVACIRRAKFNRPLVPGCRFELECSADEGDGSRWRAQLTTTDGAAARLDLVLRGLD